MSVGGRLVGWEHAPFLSTAEAALVLRVSARTALRWAESGRLPAQRDNRGRWRVVPSDLAALLDRGQLALPVEVEQ